jgi:serine O-acetyltransferase
MTFIEYKQTVLADLYRIDGQTGLPALLKELLYGEGFAYCFWMRTCAYFASRTLTRFTFYFFAKMFLRHYKYKLGISISDRTRIGPGFYIGHFGGIVVNTDARIGRNCNLSHGVTIGQSNRGNRLGCPVIGDNVFIGPGAMIFGSVHIGNNVAIGANSVVVDDVCENALVVGSPARIVNHNGSAGYVNRTDYGLEL